MNLGRFAGSAAVAAIKEWNPLGPEAYARRDRNKAYRKARRKQKRGEALTEDESRVLSQTQEVSMLPQNTMRKGGIAVTALGPVLTVVLKMVGMNECTPEEVSMGCVGAAEIAGTLLTVGGAVLYWIGRNRADAREKPVGEK